MSTQSNGVVAGESTTGFAVVFAASLLSLGSVYVFFFVVTAVDRQTSTPRIFHFPMDIFIFSLFFADLVQAVGGMLNYKWIRYGRVQAGIICDAQGILQTLGGTGVALTTLLIAIYTFFGVMTGRGLQSMRIPVALVALIWFVVGTLIGVGQATSKSMSPVPEFWCGPGVGSHLGWKLLTGYLWMWISLFASSLLYIPLYLWMRGELVFKDVWYLWSFQRGTPSDSFSRSHRRKALVMLMYPILYCVCILPLSIVRWIAFGDESKHGVTNMPPEYIFAITIFNLSGFLNVMLVFTTRPNLGLFGRHGSMSHSDRPPSPSISITQFERETQLQIEGLPYASRPNRLALLGISNVPSVNI